MEVYLHKETFDIEQNPDKINLKDFYLIQDELIASSIQVLNRKGYTTIQCCSGHPRSDNPEYLPEYLPDSYIHYTGMSYIGDSIFAIWEEQEDYSIGAAGFVVIKTLNIFSKFH